MQAPKYQADVDLANDNTSHALLARLIGNGKRVLDVGCATGYLAAALRGNGCSVSGLEYDAAAAELARPYLDALVIGDVERLDLVAEFGAGSFDAVVYGDVLEHLVDPGATLVRTRDLLAQGGVLVASVPNVAHGAVRLSLLGGEFPYRDTGLLDTTHLRFFTGVTLDRLFRDAGYTLVDVRRTTAGVFDTELGVRAGDFAPEIVELVLDDPESTTYQFVVAAVPTAEPGVDAAVLAAQEQRVAAHRRARALARAEGPAPRGPRPAPTTGARVGIAGAVDLDQFRTALLARLTAAELGRRLPSASLRLFSPYGPQRASRIDPGAALESLGSPGRDRARRLSAELDVLVVTGTVPADASVAASLYGGAPRADSPPMFLAEGLAAAGPDATATVWSAVELFPAPAAGALPERTYAGLLDGQAAEVAERPAEGRPAAGDWVDLPDPGVLAARLVEPAVLERRLTYLTVVGSYPAAGPVLVVHGDARLVDQVPAIAAMLDRLQERHPPLGVVLVELDPPRGDSAFLNALAGQLARPPKVLPVEAGLDDLLAVLACADALVSSAPTPLAVAAAYGARRLAMDFFGDRALSGVEPRVTGTDALDRHLRDLGALLAVAPPTSRSGGGELVAEQARLDVHFDRVAEIVTAAAAREPRAGWAAAYQLDPDERMVVLERAHAAVRARANAERLAMASAVVAAEDQAVDQHPELVRLRTEISALRNSKAMRALRPARSVYARLRGHRL